MTDETRVALSDDYASLVAGAWEFYFGYEVTTNPEEESEYAEWCFQARKGGIARMLIPQSELPIPRGLSGEALCVHALLAGIGEWVAQKERKEASDA